MLYNLDLALQNELSRMEPSRLYAAASHLYSCAYVNGPREIVLAIDNHHSYQVPRGLRSLDPINASAYDANLADALLGEHLVIAAVPFDPTEPFTIVVPTLALIKTQDGTWRFSAPDGTAEAARETIETILKSEPLALEPADQEATHKGLRVNELETSASFEHRVDRAISTILESDLSKVVLSKAVSVDTSEKVDMPWLLTRLSKTYPDTFLFAIDNMVGASPELVVELVGQTIRSHPLAGTAPTKDEAILLRSEKDNEEHATVVRQLISRLSELGVRTEKQLTPTIAEYGTIIHLGSEISGSLPIHPALTSLAVAAHCAPTAAINGEPPSKAMMYISSDEPLPRSMYGGLIGFQKFGGDGCWILNIRSIQVSPDTLLFRAGVGVVSKSIPAEENTEADAKLHALLSSVCSS